MALYRYNDHLVRLKGCADFEISYEPQTVAPRSGIYRCDKCGYEIIVEESTSLPNEGSCSRHGRGIGPPLRSAFGEVTWSLIAAIQPG